MKLANFVSPNRSFIHSWCEISPDLHKYAEKHALGSLTDGKVIWQTRHKRVLLCELPLEHGNEKVVFKRYYEKRFFRYLFRPSLAAREAKGYGIVSNLGLPCAELLAYGEERSGVRLKECFIITGYVANSRGGDDFCPEGCEVENLPLRDEFCRENLKMLAKLHRNGFYHGGTHPRNFLWRLNEDKLELIWIDLATVKKASRQKQIEDVEKFLAPFEMPPECVNNFISEYEQLFAQEPEK